MVTRFANTLRSHATAGVLALAALGVACGDGPVATPPQTYPATLEVDYAVPAAPSAMHVDSWAGTSATSVADSVRVKVLRGERIAYNQRHAIPPAQSSGRIRVELELQSASESLTVVVELLSGSQVVYRGTQNVTVTAGQTTAAVVQVAAVLSGRILSINGQPVVAGQTMSVSDSMRVIVRVTAPGGEGTLRYIAVEREEPEALFGRGILGCYFSGVEAGETRDILIRAGAAPAGTYPLTLRLRETNVHTINVSVTQSDVTPPAVTITQPADGSTVARDTVRVHYLATDNRSLARYRFSVNGREQRGPVYHCQPGHSPYSSYDGVVLQPGRNEVTVTVWDIGLNPATSAPLVLHR